LLKRTPQKLYFTEVVFLNSIRQPTLLPVPEGQEFLLLGANTAQQCVCAIAAQVALGEIAVPTNIKGLNESVPITQSFLFFLFTKPDQLSACLKLCVAENAIF